MGDRMADDMEIDFGKIIKKLKNFLSRPKSPPKEQSKPKDDEIEIDFRKFLGKAKEMLLSPSTASYSFLLLLLIPLFLNASIRLSSMDVPMAEVWARQSVENSIESQVAQEVRKGYPNLPDAQKDALVRENVKRVMEKDKAFLEQQINAISKEYKSRLQDENGQTYLLAIDPWQHYRRTRNLLEKGQYYDTLKNGKPWNTHKVAPLGQPAKRELHVYFGYYWHRLLSIFGDFSLTTSFFIIPVVIISAALVPVFFIARKIGGNFAGFLATTILAVHSGMLNRTVAGFSDTDAWNIFFPLIIVWLFFEACDQENRALRTVLASLSALFVGLFAFTWSGWWYVFNFIMASMVLFLIYAWWKAGIKQKKVLMNIEATAIFFVMSALFTSLLRGPVTFFKSVFGPFLFIQMKQVAVKTIWPNVFTTVAELNPISATKAIKILGGKLFLGIAIAGILLAFTKKLYDKIYDKNHGKKIMDVRYGILLGIWLVSTIYAATKGVRFSMFMIPAFAIAFGAAGGILFGRLSAPISRFLTVPQNVFRTIVLLIFCFMLISPVNSAYKEASQQIPSIDDAWVESLERIKAESRPDAIITSWWDFGHWFKAHADRAVTFDGGTQNTPMAHWVGKLLLTDDEELSVAILRMLNCGSYTGYDSINEVLNDDLKSINVLYELLKMNRVESENYLKENGFGEEQADSVLEKTHCEPPESFLITSEDMVGKSGVWGHFGSWDFERASMVRDVKKKNRVNGTKTLREKYGLDEKKAENYYESIINKDPNRWIAPWPAYNGKVRKCRVREDNASLNCGSEFVLNMSTMEVKMDSRQGRVTPPSIVYVDGETVVEKEFENATIDLSIILIPDGKDSYLYTYAQKPLGNSIFTRLFYLDGQGIRHFKKFSDKTTILNQKVIVWKVDWKGDEPKNESGTPEKTAQS